MSGPTLILLSNEDHVMNLRALIDKKVIPPINSVTIRSTALAILTVIALIVFLDWSQSFFAPIVFGMLLSYALYPIVSFLNRFWIPYWLGAAFVVLALVGAIYFAVSSSQEQALLLLDKVPKAVQHVSRISSDSKDEKPSVLDKIRSAATQVEEVTNSGKTGAKTSPEDVMRVKIYEKPIDFQEYIVGGSMSGLVFMGQVVSILLLIYFILASGRLYKEKIVRISGDKLSEKKLTIEILDEINHQLRLFFFVMLVGAFLVGVATWLAFMWLGVEQAAIWGVVAGIASMIPYLGPALIFIAVGFVSLVQFGTLSMALLVAGVSLAITSVQGNILTPLMTSRASAMNPVGIFISLLFWGWLWGPIGLIVATPIQLIIKSICDHVENFQNFGELLSD